MRRSLSLVLALFFTTTQLLAAEPKTADESVLGEFVVTGTSAEHIPKVAILPSTSPAYEDVIVRGVVRRDFEISGFFDVIPDNKAPAGDYRFTAPVNVAAWQAIGAEAIIKVAAQDAGKDKIEVLGIAYFPSVGATPVYETKLTVTKDEARRTAHKITDDLIGALTGSPGGFSSRFTYSWPVGAEPAHLLRRLRRPWPQSPHRSGGYCARPCLRPRRLSLLHAEHELPALQALQRGRGQARLGEGVPSPLQGFDLRCRLQSRSHQDGNFGGELRTKRHLRRLRQGNGLYESLGHRARDAPGLQPERQARLDRRL
ncbi:MAG: hypothetical protein B6A08_19250 [Sorangiineae bacterium NIC37A_2]|nr:MAG: hypothetical protein B6A08_19250 [Sorangiineae bacterium NIC37A_2]